MSNMFNNNTTPKTVLKTLGRRLKQERLARNESQELFSSRLGMSRQSYAKMEKGAPGVALGHWISASQILGKLPSWDSVLANDANLFDQFEQQAAGRKRAGRKQK